MSDADQPTSSDPRPGAALGLRLLKLVGSVFLALGVVGALLSVAALIVAAIAFREHFRDAGAGMRWSGSCVGVGAVCLWLHKRLETRAPG